jgi:hypothetical protein
VILQALRRNGNGLFVLRLVSSRSISSSHFDRASRRNRSGRGSGMDGTASLANRDFGHLMARNVGKCFSPVPRVAQMRPQAGLFRRFGRRIRRDGTRWRRGADLNRRDPSFRACFRAFTCISFLRRESLADKTRGRRGESSSLIDRVDLGIKLPLSNAGGGASDGSSHLSLKCHVPMHTAGATISSVADRWSRSPSVTESASNTSAGLCV